MKFFSVLLLSSCLLLSFQVQAEEKKVDNAKQFQQVGKESNYLVKTGSVLALSKLTKNKGFSPYAYILLPQGTTIVIEPEGPLKKLTIKDKVLFLRGQIKHRLEQGENIIAAAIFTDSLGTSKKDGKEVRGITVEMEHSQGPSVIEFVPYVFEDGMAVAQEGIRKLKPRSFFTN